MNLTDMMEGLRLSAAESTKITSITLTQTEIAPILTEYDQLLAEINYLSERVEQLKDQIKTCRELREYDRAELNRLRGR